MNENGPNEGAVNEGTGRENGNQRRSRGSNQGRTPPAGSGVKSAWGASPPPPATPPPSLAVKAPQSRGRVITGEPYPSSVAQSLRPGRSSEIGIGRVPYGNSTQGQRRTPGRNILPGAVSPAPVTPQNNGRHPRGRNNRRVPSTGESGTLLPSEAPISARYDPRKSVECIPPENHPLKELYLNVTKSSDGKLIKKSLNDGTGYITFMGYTLVDIKVKNDVKNDNLIEINRIKKIGEDASFIVDIYKAHNILTGAGCTKDIVYFKSNEQSIPLIYVLFEHCKSTILKDFKKNQYVLITNQTTISNMLYFLMRFRNRERFNQALARYNNTTPSDFVATYPSIIKQFFITYHLQIKDFYQGLISTEEKSAFQEIVSTLFSTRNKDRKSFNSILNNRPGVVLPQIEEAAAPSPSANAGAVAGASAVAPLPPIRGAVAPPVAASPANAGAGAGAGAANSVPRVPSSLTLPQQVVQNIVFPREEREPSFFDGILFNFIFDKSTGIESPFAGGMKYQDFIQIMKTTGDRETMIARVKNFFDRHILPRYHAGTAPFDVITENKRFPSDANSKYFDINESDKLLDSNFLSKLFLLYTLFQTEDINQSKPQKGVPKPDTFVKNIKRLFIELFYYQVSIFDYLLTKTRGNGAFMNYYNHIRTRYEGTGMSMEFLGLDEFSILFYLYARPLFQFVSTYLTTSKTITNKTIFIGDCHIVVPGKGTQYMNHFRTVYDKINTIQEESVKQPFKDFTVIVQRIFDNHTLKYGTKSLFDTNVQPLIPSAVEPANLGRNHNYYSEIVGLLENAIKKTNIENIQKIFNDPDLSKTNSIQDKIDLASNSIDYNQLLEVIYNHIELIFNKLKTPSFDTIQIQLFLLLKYIELYDKLLYCETYSKETCKLYDSIEAFKAGVPNNWISKINDLIYHKVENFYEVFKKTVDKLKSEGRVNQKIDSLFKSIFKVIEEINYERADIYTFFKGEGIPLYGYINSHIPNYNKSNQNAFVDYLNQLSDLFTQLQDAEAALPGNAPQRNAIVAIASEIQGILGKIREDQGKIPRALRKTFGNSNSLFRKFYKKYKLGEIDFGNGATEAPSQRTRGAAPVRRIRREISPPRVGTGAGSAELPPLRTTVRK